MKALEFLKEELKAQTIPTGSQQLDFALCNGFRSGVSEITGKSGTGKTQLCLQLTVNAIMPSPIVLVDGEVIYISTKRNFCPQRIIQLIDRAVNIWENNVPKEKRRYKFTRESALKRIHHKLVFSSSELLETVYQLKEDSKIRLIVIDSITAPLKSVEHEDRLRVIHELFHILNRFIAKNNCIAVMTNDLTTVTDDDTDNECMFRPDLFLPSHQRILLVKDEKQQIIAHVQKNLVHGPSLIKLRITANGIEDA